jgi:hypothetical protein
MNSLIIQMNSFIRHGRIRWIHVVNEFIVFTNEFIYKTQETRIRWIQQQRIRWIHVVNEFIVFINEFIYKTRGKQYEMNSLKVIRQMNSSTAILLQMNSTATPLMWLPPCACNTATPLPTRRCPADYAVKPTRTSRSHGEHCAGDAELPPHCCRAASANAAGCAN